MVKIWKERTNKGYWKYCGGERNHTKVPQPNQIRECRSNDEHHVSDGPISEMAFVSWH